MKMQNICTVSQPLAGLIMCTPGGHCDRGRERVHQVVLMEPTLQLAWLHLLNTTTIWKFLSLFYTEDLWKLS